MTSPESLDALVERIAGRSVLVVGDLMVDHFVYGRVTRISPEAPVPVVQFEREDTRLGGAANVANNIAALGGRATAVGVVGADDEAARLRAALETLSVGTAGIVADTSRCTTRKLRVVTTRNQQVARIDYESEDEIAGAIEDAVVDQVIAGARHADAVLISDYLKGVVSRRVSRACMLEASRRGIPVLVDP
jgi:D-beta-D-heptose 7-phosphate kinase/D-beta-D-heptose 1-phosphate adenosyltransferase